MYCRKIDEVTRGQNVIEGMIFEGATSDSLQILKKNAITNTYKRGTTIILQGNPCFGVFFICKGKVKLSRVNRNGEETIIGILDAGGVIGHTAMFAGSTYKTTAQTLTDSEIRFLDCQSLNSILKHDVSVARNFEKYMADRIHQMENKIHSFARKNVRERLAELIIYLWDNFKCSGEDSQKIDLALSRDEMASILGVASETLIRLMSEFKSDGLINKKGRTIYLLDRKKMKEYANIV